MSGNESQGNYRNKGVWLIAHSSNAQRHLEMNKKFRSWMNTRRIVTPQVAKYENGLLIFKFFSLRLSGHVFWFWENQSKITKLKQMRERIKYKNWGKSFDGFPNPSSDFFLRFPCRPALYATQLFHNIWISLELISFLLQLEVSYCHLQAKQDQEMKWKTHVYYRKYIKWSELM